MQTSDAGFIQSLLPAGPAADCVFTYLKEVEERGPVWQVTGGLLGKEIERFERLHIAAGYAATLGADVQKVSRRQDFLVRTAVTSILFPLEAFEDRLLVHLEERGLPSLFHHVIKEFVAQDGANISEIHAIAGACRSATFRIEDEMRAYEPSEKAAHRVVDIHTQLVNLLHTRIDADKVPFAWPGVALIWVSALIGLGGLPSESSTTEHYAEPE